MKSKHEWVAIFTLHLTDQEAAQAYTFDYHGKKVLVSKVREEDGFVDVGCYKCELPYTTVNGKPCVESSFIKDYDKQLNNTATGEEEV
jgi:hypothetical protein